MEKKILKEFQNITKELKVIGKELKVIGKNIKKDTEEGLAYDQEDAIDFIRLRLKKEHEAEITEGLLRAILELEEDYMRSVGIIED